MGSVTPKGYPYPVGTDRVMDGDDAIKALATAVDTKLGAAAAGTLDITGLAANGTGSVAVTFPAGRFTASPTAVMFTVYSGNPTGSNAYSAVWVTPGAITKDGMTAQGRRASAGDISAYWTAAQV
jgi:hypothetical protein